MEHLRLQPSRASLYSNDSDSATNDSARFANANNSLVAREYSDLQVDNEKGFHIINLNKPNFYALLHPPTKEMFVVNATFACEDSSLFCNFFEFAVING